MTPQTLALIERYDALTRTLEDQVIQRVNKRLDEALRELEQALVKSFDSTANLPLLAASRRAVLMEQLSELLQVVRPDLADEYERIFTDMVAAATRGGGKMAGELMAALAPTSTIRQFAGIPVEAIAAQARDGVRRLYRYNDTFRDKASAVVEMGLAQGKGTRWVAAELRREVGVTKSKAEAIARTETLAALNTGLQTTYEQNGIQYVLFQATVDARTCPYCAARNGKAYKMGDISLPLHPMDRCVLLPWSPEWGKAGIFNEAATRSLREQAIKELRANGKEPNNGVAPFERAANMKKPPTPVWSPE